MPFILFRLSAINKLTNADNGKTGHANKLMCKRKNYSLEKVIKV